MLVLGRIIVFALKDEGSYNLRGGVRTALAQLGSTKSRDLSWRDMWACVTIKPGPRVEPSSPQVEIIADISHNEVLNIHYPVGGLHETGQNTVRSKKKANKSSPRRPTLAIAEELSRSPDFNSWGKPVVLRAEVPLVAAHESECAWPDTDEHRRRRDFCGHIEGYGSVCACDEPAPLAFSTEQLLNNRVHDVPVTIIASNRPHYLYRCLRSLLGAPGVNPSLVTVFIDGYYEEPLAVTRLFGLRGIQHTPLGVRNARISQHYKASLTATFNIFPSARHAIILEEDLDVSPDFFSYFSQTLFLLDEDPTLYCISAWNDQGYEHTSGDPALLYRVDTMPGLGWLLSRDLYKHELEPVWPTPEKMWDWDMWMRLPDIRKSRECIVPDVSRTYHFGSSGLNMNSFFQDAYFKKHAFSTARYVELRDVTKMKAADYEELMQDLIRQGTTLDPSRGGDPCREGFVPPPSALDTTTYVLYITMASQQDFAAWLHLAKCWHIWDLDGRGSHKGAWRLHMNGSPLVVVGTPHSPYSTFQPKDVASFNTTQVSKPASNLELGGNDVQTR
ncbi:protein O-linked-mannose beta-1,2-N-acetylglucosaminyltransferase 1 isoform X2 [Hyalella azteca]|uniref:Alpha-1,3-mannosyl-glycoprotein 2-beta-N-acetylglucosaminyltransferase n=1 Tax=Hyalella azteca TaxID=294128 RepID=A0A979FSZ2_HYAAZ|nr:protein O-linked-mannose beta-1,2-N-acetylglucosaminyltransferase 1 isoform X2 [Hyalella azteca]